MFDERITGIRTFFPHRRIMNIGRGPPKGGVVVFDVPKALFDKLPAGDLTQGERVVKYSIPDKYAVGTIRPEASATK